MADRFKDAAVEIKDDIVELKNKIKNKLKF